MSKLVGRVAGPDFVPMSSELVRVSKVPRRVMAPEDAEWLADELTKRLRKPRGTMRLRPVQAWLLYELGTVGGVFGPVTVGAGKTLPTLLAPTVMHAERPLLVVPAGLVEKTQRDKEVLEQHWCIPPFIRIMSYEWLGREQAGDDPKIGKRDALTAWGPDLVILDECHRARNNRGAAVARRLTRFFRNHPQSRCVALSGTVTKRSIRDYAHILTWCLPAELLPIPTHHNDLDFWADALDEKKGDGARIDPGALEALCADEADRELWKTDRVDAARRTFRRRLVETPGVVATYESNVDATLIVRAVGVTPGPSVDEAFKTLKGWTTPDGWSIPDAIAWSRHAKELALGFFYRWSPRPPIDWQVARTEWHSYVRKFLKRSRTYDSEKQARRAVLHLALKALPEAWHAYATEIATPPKDPAKRTLTTEQRQQCGAHLVELVSSLKFKSEEDQRAVKLLFAWKGVQDTFTPNTVPVWIDSVACEFIADWAKRNAGIVWVEHKCVGERLRDEFGLPYYGRKGLDASGRMIDDHDPGTSLVASRAANGEGRNLQAWSKNLITSLLPNGSRNEQLLGRTHREGTTADEVEVEFIVSCRAHLESLEQAMNDARYIQSSTGAPQKLLIATLDVDSAKLSGRGPRWDDKFEDT